MLDPSLPASALFFGRLYGRYGYRTRYRYVVRPLLAAVVRHELSSIARMARDRRRALCLLDEADSARTRRRTYRGRPRLAGDDNAVAMGLLFYLAADRRW